MHPIDVLGQMTIEHDYFQYHVMLLLVLPNIISLFALELITLITALNDLISILMYFNYKVLLLKHSFGILRFMHNIILNN